MYKYILVFAVVLSFISCSDNLEIADESAIETQSFEFDNSIIETRQAGKRAARDGRNPQTGATSTSTTDTDNSGTSNARDGRNPQTGA